MRRPFMRACGINLTANITAVQIKLQTIDVGLRALGFSYPACLVVDQAPPQRILFPRQDAKNAKERFCRSRFGNV